MAKVILYSPHVIGKSMAGPAIRSWEFAKALSHEHAVTLISPHPPTLESKQFKVIALSSKELKPALKEADVLVTQTLSLKQALWAKHYRLQVIIDAYDPVPLELLEQFKHHSPNHRTEINTNSITNLIFNFKMAAGIICASEKQRDLWLGFLLGQKWITPKLYDQDCALRQFIDVVPFGLPNDPPKKIAPGLREKYQLAQSDKIILWGGGIWDWFDPLSLIKAVKQISLIREDIKLIFMGIKSPDANAVEMSMCGKAIELAKELHLLNRFVFFNEGWVPYEERQNILLEADIGVSTHLDHLETRFSFRTRLLDYIWATLPILATTGDSFAEWIEKENLGLVVPYQDEKALVDAILRLLEDRPLIAKIKANLIQMQERFRWQSITKPLSQMISHLGSFPPSNSWNYRDFKTIASFILTKSKEKGIKSCCKKLFS